MSARMPGLADTCRVTGGGGGGRQRGGRPGRHTGEGLQTLCEKQVYTVSFITHEVEPGRHTGEGLARTSRRGSVAAKAETAGGGVVSPDVYRLSSPCSELETLCRISWTAQHYRRSSTCTSSVLSSNSPLERGCGHPGMRPDARICGLSPRALKGAAMAPISSTYQDSSSVRLKAAQATTMKHISR